MLSYEAGAQGGTPGFLRCQNGGGGFFHHVVVAVDGTGQAVPGFDTDELRFAGFAPDEHIGEIADGADHTAAGILFVQTQSPGGQAGHAMAVVVKQVLVHRDGLEIAADAVPGLIHQAGRGDTQTQGRFHLVKGQNIVREGMLVIKGNGKAGVVADAEGHGGLVTVFHRQGMVQGIPLQVFIFP